MVLLRSISPRKRSPAKRRNRTSVAPSTVSSCSSPSRRSRRSASSNASTAVSMEEPPPTISHDLSILACEPAGGSLRASFPMPLSTSSWDWPLSREEKKTLVLMFDRQELMVQREDYADQLHNLKLRC